MKSCRTNLTSCGHFKEYFEVRIGVLDDDFRSVQNLAALCYIQCISLTFQSVYQSDVSMKTIMTPSWQNYIMFMLLIMYFEHDEHVSELHIVYTRPGGGGVSGKLG